VPVNGDDKKYQHKYELKVQNKQIAAIRREIEQKTGECIPEEQLHALKRRLSSEECKLKQMKKATMLEELTESLLKDNDCLEADRYRMQEEVLVRDEAIQQLQKRVEVLRAEMLKICFKMSSQSVPSCSDKSVQHESNCSLKVQQSCVHSDKQQPKSVSCVPSSVSGTSSNVAKIFECFPIHNCPKNSPPRPLTIHHQQQQPDCKQLGDFMLDSGNNRKAENEALKQRADVLVGEISDYKVLITELTSQVDRYRGKFLKGKLFCKLYRRNKLN